MKRKTIINIFLMLAAAFFCCSCASINHQMNSYENKIEAQIKKKHWFAAKYISEKSKFNDYDKYKGIIDGWRKYQQGKIKSGFAKSLVPWIDDVKELYESGDFEAGDAERLRLRNYYFGGVVASENAIMPELEECVHLALLQMQSDRSLALMTDRFKKLNDRILSVNIEDEHKAYKELDRCKSEIPKILHFKNKIDEFMLAIDPEDVRRWAQMNRTTYARDIKNMEKFQEDCLKNISFKLWEIDVTKRKKEYTKIYRFIDELKFEQASTTLASLKVIYPPQELGETDYDDVKERQKVENAYALKLWSSQTEKRKQEYQKIRELIEGQKFEQASTMLASLKVIYPPENIDYSNFDDNAERKKIGNFYALKLWETQVQKRKGEYSKIRMLIDKGDFSRAGEELSFLKPIKSPNLKGSVYFDDKVEHQKLLNRVLEASWNKDVKNRRAQYSKIESLVNAKKFDEAIKILSETSERLTKPDIRGLPDYDDDQERAAVLSGELGMLIVYQIFNSGMSGVQHYRLTSDDELLSVIVVGRSYINYHGKTKTRAIRDAANRAEIDARNEFAKFLEVRQTSFESSKINYDGTNVEESYKSATRLETTTILSGMILLAKGIQGGEVVCIMGWQSPQSRISTIMPMKSFQKKEFSISPSIGFFL